MLQLVMMLVLVMLLFVAAVVGLLTSLLDAVVAIAAGGASCRCRWLVMRPVSYS